MLWLLLKEVLAWECMLRWHWRPVCCSEPVLGTPTEPAAKAQKDVENAAVVTSENTTIKIFPGTKIKLYQVKTEQGKRITESSIDKGTFMRPSGCRLLQ